MKNMIERIRLAKTWRERIEIAEDKLPGTSFDEMFQRANLAKTMWKAYRPKTWQIQREIGFEMVRIILNGQVQRLHEMTKALEIWKRHKPKPNYELIALFKMGESFPPGWTKLWARWGRDASGQLVAGLSTPLPLGTRDRIAMRDVKVCLAEHDPKFSEERWESSRRKIQRYAKELGIPLDGKAGSPVKKLRHNQRNKAGL